MFKDTWDAYGGTGDTFLPRIETTDTDNNNLEAFKVFVQDPVSNIILEHPMPPEVDVTTIPQTTEEWTVDTNVPIPPILQYIQNYVEAQGGECGFIGADTIVPASKYTVVKFQNLKPRKMYTAIVTNAFNGIRKQVHDFAFQTSRYASFEEQVNSYKLDVENSIKAIYDINLELTDAEIIKAYNILIATTSTNDTQETEFLDYLDRILEGVFKMKPLDPPVTTEFNIIRNQKTNNAVAVLIRNPEPFNDPKIPLEVIKGDASIFDIENNTDVHGTIEVLNIDGTVDANYKVLFSKDYSQALIMHKTKKIVDSNLSLRFRYTNWNGHTYVIEKPKSTIVIDRIEIK